MKQKRLVSLFEEFAKRLGVLFIIAPVVSMVWLPYLGMEVNGYWHGVWISWPYVACALVYGYCLRRYFEGRK